MSQPTLEERVKRLEIDVAALKKGAHNGEKRTDWRSIIGMFKDEEGMKRIFDNALAIREKDREAARRRESRRKRPNKK